MKWHIAIVMAAGSLLAANAADETKKDIALWQGVWRAVSMETDGKLAPPEELKKIKLTVQGTDYHFQNGGFSEHGAYRFKAAENPKQLDIVVGDGKDKGKVYLVIYKVAGDELTICLETANQRRPREFTGKTGSGQVLEVWRREAPAAASAALSGSVKTADSSPSDFARSTIDLGVVVSDVARSVKFYTHAIGFTEVQGFSVPADFCAEAGLTDKLALDIRVLVLGEGDTATKLKLMQVPGAVVKKDDNAFIHSQLGYRYLTIYVADGDAALERLKQAGAKPLAKGPVPLPAGLPPGLALTVVRDPDGNLIELIGPKR